MMGKERGFMTKVFKKPQLVVKAPTVVISSRKSALCSDGSSHIVVDTSSN